MAKATILLVDNDRDFLETSAIFLESKGFQVVATRNQQEAKQKLEHEKIDLAVIDLRLSSDEDEEDLSGYTLAIELPASLPKIILTYFAYPQDKPFQLRSSNPLELISKVAGSDMLLTTIEGLLRNRLAGNPTTDAPPPDNKKKKGKRK